MIELKQMQPIHVLAIIVLIVVFYNQFVKQPNEKYGPIPRLGPIDYYINAYSDNIMPYSFGVPHKPSLCHTIKNPCFCSSRTNCKWDNYYGCRYYGEGK